MSALIKRWGGFCCLVGVAAVSLVGAGGRTAQAIEGFGSDGFYVGGGLGQEWVGVDYKKSVAIPDDSINGEAVTNSYRETSNDATQAVPAFKVFLGHRWRLPGRFYVSGEVEGTVYSNARVTGSLEGTGRTTLDVWPGTWAFEKHWSVGVNVRGGYRPEALAFLGEARSVYLFSGVQYLDVAVEDGFDNRDPEGHDLDSLCGAAGVPCDLQPLRGTRNGDRTAVPWLIGGGVEIGSNEHRVDVRIQYAMYEVDFNVPDPSQGVFLNHEFAADEVGISLAYVRFFEFGSFL